MQVAIKVLAIVAASLAKEAAIYAAQKACDWIKKKAKKTEAAG